MSFTPDRPTSTTNELAKARNRAAAERTLTSWIQNCLVLIGFGAAFDRIFSALRQIFPESTLLRSDLLTKTIGLSAIAIGIFLLLLAIQTYRTQLQWLEQTDSLNQPTPNHWLAIAVGTILLFGIAALLGIFVLMADA